MPLTSDAKGYRSYATAPLGGGPDQAFRAGWVEEAACEKHPPSVRANAASLKRDTVVGLSSNAAYNYSPSDIDQSDGWPRLTTPPSPRAIFRGHFHPPCFTPPAEVDVAAEGEAVALAPGVACVLAEHRRAT